MRRYTTVEDVMTKDVVTVDARTPFKDIARLLARHRISAVPVVDNAGWPLGVVSETDLVRKEEFRAPGPAGRFARWRRTARAKAGGRTAAEVMSAPAITIKPDASLQSAARTLAGHHITRLVVVDEGGVIAGVVTRSDLLRTFLASDEQIRERVVRDVVMHALWEDPATLLVDVQEGVVTLSGEVERRTLVPIAANLTRCVDGVVDVVNLLDYVDDDTKPVPNPLPEQYRT
ncbi:CBS domain-containing protein [Flindersiella endophytica]